MSETVSPTTSLAGNASTTASVDGEKQTNPGEQITVEDVVAYKHLIPGKEYTLKGILMNRATGEPFLVNGQPVTSEVTFIPIEPSGTVTVTFVFDGSAIMQNTELVVFESLYKDGVELTAHADIEDEGQTVTVLPPPPEIPQTGDSSNLGFWIGLGAIALGGLVSLAIIYFKKKKDGDE